MQYKKIELIKNNQKIISKLLEKGKAKEKYVDTITTGNSSFIAYNKENEIKICLGNIPPGEKIELKTYFFSHIITKDFSYQTTFPVKFPNFVMTEQESKENSIIIKDLNIMNMKIWKFMEKYLLILILK